MLLHTVVPLSKRLPFSKGGARSARAVREAARSKPSKARSVASEPCERREATMPHCGMLAAKPTEGMASRNFTQPALSLFFETGLVQSIDKVSEERGFDQK